MVQAVQNDLGWEDEGLPQFASSDDDISLRRKEIGCHGPCVHGKVEIEGITARQLFQVLINPHNMSIFDETFIRAKILDNLDSAGDQALSVCWHAMKIMSVVSELDTILTNRDFVYVQVLKKLSQSKRSCVHVILQRSVDCSHDSVSYRGTEAYVRGTVWVSGFILKPGSSHKSCIVEHVYAANLDGVLAQFVCADMVSRRLRGLKRFASTFQDDQSRLAILSEVTMYNLDHQSDTSEVEECKRIDDEYLTWSESLRAKAFGSETNTSTSS